MTTPSDGASACARTISALQSARASRPELGESIDLSIAILQAREGVVIGHRHTDAGNGLSTLSSSRPFLSVQSVVSDWNAFADLFCRICLIVARHRPEQARVFEEFAGDASRHLQMWTDAYLRNELYACGAPQPSLLSFVLNNTLHPFLAATPAFAEWEKQADKDAGALGHCPACQSEPDFGALEKEAGRLLLLCSRCDAEWVFRRTMCPFCSAAGAENWGHYPSDEGTYRLYVCGNCRRYLKTIDLRELARPVDLPAERVLTLHMDIAALAAGYVVSPIADPIPAN